MQGDHSDARMGSGKTPNIREENGKAERKELRLKSSASCVTIHIGHRIIQRGRHFVP